MRSSNFALASLLLVGPTASAERCSPATAPDLLLEIESGFPAAHKWFGMVSDLSWDRATDGTLTPRFSTQKSRFVLPRDPANQRLTARLPPRASGAHQVILEEGPDVSVRTEELGVAPAPAEVLRGMVIYRGAVAGGDLMYKLTPTHVDEYVYFRDPPPGLRREFEFDVGRGVAKLREAGRLVEVIGKDGAAHLRLSAPVARAADGTRRTGTVIVEGPRLIEEIDLRGLVPPILVDPDWSTTGTMTVAHWADSALHLPDDRVMAVGGCALAVCPIGLATSACNQVLPFTDIWTPANGTWTSGPPLRTARYSYGAAVLGNDDLLVGGGCTVTGCQSTTDTVERYAVAQGTWTDAGTLPSPRANLMAAALPAGGALFAGGCDTERCFSDGARYDAAKNTWAPAAALSFARGYATATALADGTVLVIGGCADAACATVLGDAERYDPVADRWQPAGTMATPRAGHAATLLDDGTVLVSGGCSEQSCKAKTLTSSEIWRLDDNGGLFTPGATMTTPRHHHTATLLANGEVLLAGGTDATNATKAAAEIYFPVSRRFFEAPRMMDSRAYHVAVKLDSGNVLVAGGCNPATCLPFAEVFSPAGLPVESGDGGIWDAGAPVDLAPAGPPDWGAPLAVEGGPHPKLFRTGATSCATDDAQDLPCPIAGFPAQDGEYQPDTHPFVPSGDEVHDTVTGLTWQAVDDGKTYSNDDAIAQCAKLSTGAAGAGSWRLPTVVELMTTIDFATAGPSMDQAFANAQPTNYWTVSPVAGSKTLAWTVKFDAGEVVPLLRDSALPIRCVRGQLTAAPAGGGHLRLAGPYTVTPNTVRDEANVLEWQRRDDDQRRNWREALDYCATLDLDGHHDWHLPNVAELLGIVEFASTDPVKIDPAFDGAEGDLYWTSTFGEGAPTLSWSITFNMGIVDGVTTTGLGYARCVRHIQPPPAPPSGCGCHVAAAPARGSLVAALLVAALLALALLRRRAAATGTAR